MANSKLIIVEGPQGVGKTTITDFIRNSIPYTNLYRLSGTRDATAYGKVKAKKMYEDLINYIKDLQNMSINLLFDRTFFTEEIYCRLGFKQYSFTDQYEKFLNELANMDFDIYYITLFLSDEDEYERRLTRKGNANQKAKVSYAKFDKTSSVNQQKEYLNMADEIRKAYPNIHVLNIDNCREQENVQADIKSILNWKD